MVDSHVTHMVMKAGEDCVAKLSWEYKLVSCLGPHLASPVQDFVMELEKVQFSEEEWKVRKLGAQHGECCVPIFDLGDNMLYTLIGSLLICYLCFSQRRDGWQTSKLLFLPIAVGHSTRGHGKNLY